MLRWSLLLFVVWAAGVVDVSAAATAEAFSRPESQVRDGRQVLSLASRRLVEVTREVGDVESSQTYKDLADRALESQRDADDLARQLSPALEQVDARIAQLGSAAEGAAEGADLVAQRKALNTQRTSLDSLIKQANLVSLEARQLADSIEKRRVQQLSQKLSERVESPLSPLLWAKVVRSLPQDMSHYQILLRQGETALRKAWKGNGPWLIAGAVLLALVTMFPIRLWLRALGRRAAASSRAPQGRLRRTGLAVWSLCVGTLLPGLSIWLVISALRTLDAIAPRLTSVADAMVMGTFLSAFIAALSACLLLPHRPSWRLLPLDDETAAKLRKYAWIAAGLMWLTVVLQAFNRAARTSQITGVALDGLLVLSYIGLILAMLFTIARLNRRRQAAQANGASRSIQAGGNGWLVLVRVLGHMTVLGALIAALLGWINLAMTAAQQMIWIGVVCLAMSLLLKFVDDVAMRLFAIDSRSGRAMMIATGITDGRLEQIGVLLSALLRIGLVMLAVAAVTVPQGNTNLFTGWMNTLSNGLSIGDTVLRPAAFLRALMVLVVGVGLVQLFQRWLVDTYLPRTGMDIGGRNSVSTATRYLGYLVVALWTLAALGIGFEKLALVVSALSVGIGFGLQAITQNFVSGLILLAERPVKIGDWVRIGDAEGDVRRISVRATEIQVADKSTLVVPNSELITKPLRNMTLANPLGRVQIKFQVPLSTDIGALRALLLDTFAGHPDVMSEPAPAFLVESIDGGMIAINSHCHVGSPRRVSAVRSDLLIAVLEGLHAAGIPLSSPTDIHLVQPER